MLRTLSRITAIAGLAGLLIAPLATAQLARVDLGAADVLFQPQLGAASWTLTVTGPDGDFTQTFAGDETPSFVLSSVVGNDGTYRWELVRTPDFTEAQRAEMAEARANGVTLKSAGEIPVRQSGSFQVQGGAIVAQELTEPSSGLGLARAGQGTADSGAASAGTAAVDKQYFANQNVEVDGNLCVGSDCTTSESYGFDTIRLKENNLRIKFDDTSSGSFPNTDWEIQINDTNSGGDNYFRIRNSSANRNPVKIDGEARGNSLVLTYTDSSNANKRRVGFGTASPVLSLHAVDGNTPGLRLEQDGSSGFNSQIWDIAGNEVNFFIRDITNSSTLPFRLEPGAPADSLYIDSSGNIGLGTDSPDVALEVENNSDANVFASVKNENTGTSAAAVVRVDADGSGMNFTAHGSGRTLTRFGETLGGWNELLSFTGNGLILGTSTAGSSVILGTEGQAVMEITDSQTVVVNGTQVHADYVFEPDYALPSIDEQAEHMMTQKHLPAIGPARVNAQGLETFEIGSDRQGIVEELEKAHLYIVQLHERLERLEQALEDSVE